MTEANRAKAGEWPWWLPEQLLLVLVAASLAPGAFGVFLAAHGRLALGLAVLGLWLVPYALVLRMLHRSGVVRFTVSLPCTLAVLLAVLFIP